MHARADALLGIMYAARGAAVAPDDPLEHASETIMVVVGEDVVEAPFRPLGLLLRQLLLLHEDGAAADCGVAVHADDLDALLRGAFLLVCGADPATLPPRAPSARAVQVTALFVAAADALGAIAKLLGLPGYFPPPAELLSGRLLAHMHARTPEVEAMWNTYAQVLPALEMESLRESVLAAFADPDGLLQPAASLEVAPGIADGEDGEEEGEEDEADAEEEWDQEAMPMVQEKLPILEHRSKILDHIRAHKVTCIQGETGCGKSSMVPQFLVEDAQARGERIKVMVTQPRRIAAVSLARRVADQRGEPLGKQVGYRIGQGDHVDGRATLITFVTVGYLLQYLSHNPAQMLKWTHVVLDEVHERTMDTDLLNLLVMKLSQLQRGATRLIVMSATLQAGLFGEYFSPPGEPVAPPIFVGVRRYPVQSVFLEDLCHAIPALRSSVGKQVSRAVANFEQAARAAGGDVAEDSPSGRGHGARRGVVSSELRRIIVETVCYLARPSSCILVFLPGIGEIADLQDDLEGQGEVPLQVLVLHSLVPREEQDASMAPALEGHCKVVLSTNIAESSITIPDVLYVLDCGLHRGIFYDDKRRMPSLLCVWCSQASARQRSGRAGRVAPGTILHLYTKAFHERCMPAFDDAEILRVPLEKTVLRVKMLLSNFGTITGLLSQALTPPPAARVLSAIRVLYEAGALTSNDEESEVSELGRLAADMPVDLPLVKLVLLGRAFGALPDAVVMAAALSLQDLFLMPASVFERDICSFLRNLSENFAHRTRFDGGTCSEPLTYLALYGAWLLSDHSGNWAHKNGVSLARMARMDMMVADLSSKLVSLLDGTRADEHQRIRLEALHAASRARGRSSKDVVASLFCADLDRLRFILAGACAPNFILGTVKQQKKDASEATKAGLVRPRTLLFGKLPKEINHEAAVKSLLSQAGLPCSGFRKLAPERALVELACHTMDPPDEEILGEDRKGVHSRHDKHMAGSGGSSLVRGPLVQDMRFYAKLVLQLFMSERRKLVLPNPNFRPGGSAPPEVTITGIAAERPVAWSLGATGTRVHPYWRSNVGSTSDFNEAYQFRFGVALSFLGTENEMAVRALGVTLLPAGLFSKVLQLIFTPPDQPLRICCSMDRTQIYAAKVGPSKVSFAPAALSLSDMAAVNKARKMVSVAIAGEGGSQGSVREIEVTVMALMNLLLRPGGTEDTKESDSGSQRKNWIACELERGTDYLPQISLATAAIFQSASDQQESGGVGGEKVPHSRGSDPSISLLCSHDFNVAAQLPPGCWMSTREECSTGTHAWHEIVVSKGFPDNAQKFTAQAKIVLTWFKGATQYDANAVLEFPPVLSAQQRAILHDVGKKIGLQHKSSGGKNDRRLMVCRNLAAIKHIQKRGGVSAVASGGGPIGALPQDEAFGAGTGQVVAENVSQISSALSLPELLAVLGDRLATILRPYSPQVCNLLKTPAHAPFISTSFRIPSQYHLCAVLMRRFGLAHCACGSLCVPQGLLVEAVASEYANVFGEPLPLARLSELAGGGRLSVTDLTALLPPEIAIIRAPHCKPRIVVRDPSCDGPKKETKQAEPSMLPVGKAQATTSSKGMVEAKERAGNNAALGGGSTGYEWGPEVVAAVRSLPGLAAEGRGMSKKKIEDAVAVLLGRKIRFEKVRNPNHPQGRS